MTENELRERITELEIDKDTVLVISIVGKPKDMIGKLEFYVTNSPAILNGKVGMRFQYMTNGSFVPEVGGVPLDSLIQIDIK